MLARASRAGGNRHDSVWMFWFRASPAGSPALMSVAYRDASPVSRQLVLADMRSKHERAIQELGLPSEDGARIRAALENDFSDIRDLLKAVSVPCFAGFPPCDGVRPGSPRRGVFRIVSLLYEATGAKLSRFDVNGLLPSAGA